MSKITPGATDVMTCVGASCTHHGAGHALSPIRARVASATSAKWGDGILAVAGSDGWLAIDLIEAGTRAWVWHHAELADAVSVGEPVALHAVYDVLAIGSARLSVLRAAL
ncbi:hypothetical protein WDJ51_10450 [Rathayibacter sp. YIM 133350]|uniref:hypothetical protein n=1 Tax=Rathayibacter sp. YIM 133350 TaxID=3131992 RepID=UPI00307FA9F5